MIPIPTARAATLAVASGVSGFVSPWAPLVTVVVITTTVLALVVADALAAPSPAAIAIERRLPAVVTIGHTAPVGWVVTNGSSRVASIRVADALAPSLQADDRRFRLRLEPGAVAEVQVDIAPTRRGAFVVDELVVRVDGPLGLGARQRSRTQPALLRVHPRFRGRSEAELRIRRGRLLEVGLRSTAGRGGGTDFDQLREYQHDDEFRRIDWAATARTQHLVVRTYRAERNQVVVQLLDNGRVMAGRVAGVPRVEHATDAAMMLTAVAGHLGDKVGLVAFDRQVRAVVAPAAGRRQIGTLTEALYDLEPSLYESDYRSAFTYALTRFRRRTMLVVYTDLVAQAVEESLLPALPLIAGQHVLVVAAVQDPDVARWAGEVPADAAATYRQGAAIETLADRRRAIARLQSLGATVIDAPPGELSERLADAYLEVKASGRL